tara:strand:+ start:2708 stop:3136 length:429 start_codon:yes stop_codon:yes gene_type:complete
MKKVRTFSTLYLSLLTMLLMSGCSTTPGSDKERGSVTITVKNGAEPVTGVQVSLQSSTTGEGSSGVLDDQGIVVLEDVVLGEYSVIVSPFPPDDPSLMNAEGVMPDIKPNPLVPSKYSSTTTSPLTLEVKAEPGEFMFDLKE